MKLKDTIKKYFKSLPYRLQLFFLLIFFAPFAPFACIFGALYTMVMKIDEKDESRVL